MQSISCAHTPIKSNPTSRHASSTHKQPSSVVSSLPTSPTVVSIVPMSQPVTPKSGPTTPTGFFTFRWLLSAPKKTSKRKTSKDSERSLKGMRNNKSAEKFSASLSNGSKKILSRQSYSFDDVQQFLINNNANTSDNKNNSMNNEQVIKIPINNEQVIGSQNIGQNNDQLKSHIYKSNLEIAYNDKGGKSKKSTNVSCKLCLMSKGNFEMHSIWSCGCSFCKECLSQYCETLIREGKVTSLTCPDGSCTQQQSKTNYLSPKEVKHLVSHESYEIYERFRLNWVVEHDPNRTWCPTPNCETVCYLKSPRIKNKPVPVFCANCNKTFCSVCRRNWHSGIDCKKYTENDDFNLNEMSHIKRCPKCCILIERDEGCAQMMCRNCKHVFCWFCLSSLEDDFLLRHYDKGPCKNKLGHSRASVIWHRTQVVGIFAGFGLLILLASPMFLLAAPCLLCCKCNSWCKYDDHDDDTEDDFHHIGSDYNNRNESYSIM